MASPKTMRIKDEEQVRRLCEFLRRYRSWPERYHADAVSRACYGMGSARDRLAALFRNALASNTGGGLSINGAAMRKFCKKISRLGNRKRIKPSEFLSCFGSSSATELFDALIEIKGVNKKKAALFLRDLSVAGSLRSNDRIFDRTFPPKEHLRIPFDRVIAAVLNRFVKGVRFREGTDLARFFDRVNELAENASGGDRMLLEDLWFWGFFSLSGGGFRRRRAVNHAKLCMDPFFVRNARPLGLFRQFGHLVFGTTHPK